MPDLRNSFIEMQTRLQLLSKVIQSLDIESAVIDLKENQIEQCELSYIQALEILKMNELGDLEKEVSRLEYLWGELILCIEEGWDVASAQRLAKKLYLHLGRLGDKIKSEELWNLVKDKPKLSPVDSPFQLALRGKQLYRSGKTEEGLALFKKAFDAIFAYPSMGYRARGIKKVFGQLIITSFEDAVLFLDYFSIENIEYRDLAILNMIRYLPHNRFQEGLKLIKQIQGEHQKITAQEISFLKIHRENHELGFALIKEVRDRVKRNKCLSLLAEVCVNHEGVDQAMHYCHMITDHDLRIHTERAIVTKYTQLKIRQGRPEVQKELQSRLIHKFHRTKE